MITDYKIKASDFTGLDVSSLPDQPAMSSSELKARFDSPAKVVVTGKYNAMIDALASSDDGASGAHIVASAPVVGLENPDGKLATVVHDQISALQKNILGVVNKDFPNNSLDGAKIINGTVSAEKLGDINGAKMPVTLELPIAPGETLKTPCVVKLGKNGVETPKLKFFRGMKNFWADNQIESPDGILNAQTMYHLFENFVLVSYFKYVSASTYKQTIIIARLENNFLVPVTTVYSSPVNGSSTRMYPMLRRRKDGTFLLGFVDYHQKMTCVYHFSFNGTGYSLLASYSGLSGQQHDHNSRFLALSDDKLVLKYYLSATPYTTYALVLKLSFTAGGTYTLHTASSNYNMIRLSDSKFIFQQSLTVLKAVTVSDTSLTIGTAFTYHKDVLHVYPVSEKCAVYYFKESSNSLDYALLNISDSNVITAAAAVNLLTVNSMQNVYPMQEGYCMATYNTLGYEKGPRNATTIFENTESGVKACGFGLWPFLNIYQTLQEQNYPSYYESQWATDNPFPTPYTICVSNYADSTYAGVMKYGVVEFGSTLEPLEWVGMAVSQSGGKAKVLTGAGSVSGFTGLKPGETYSVSYRGGICDIKNHPMSVKIGIAIDSSTLWFTGITK